MKSASCDLGGPLAARRRLLAARRGLLALVCMAWVLLALGCSSRAPKERALRVVSLSPSTTEALVAIGAGERLVGRSRFCNYPPEVERLPTVGGYSDPSVEAILALAPSLVVGARGPAGAGIANQLERHGVRIAFPPTESWADVRAMMLSLGTELSLQAEAAAALERFDRETELAEAEFRAQRRPRVLLVFGFSPVVVAGPGSIADELAARANLENVVRAGGAYPTLPAERLLALEPEVILDMAMEDGGDRLAQAPVWRELAAVRSGRIVHLHDDTTVRPGPRLPEGLRRLGRAVHGAIATGQPGVSQEARP